MKVCKFGGSSVAEASQIQKVKNIIESDQTRRLIVVSAPGKRNNKDEKITDLLYRCNDEVTGGKKTSTFAIVRERFMEISNSLSLGDMSEILDEVESGINSGMGPDYAASRGEYIAARMFADFFGAEFIDAGDFIRITDDGRVDESSYSNLKNRINDDGRYIIPGFYGADPKGKIKTFSRGGSDITGAIVARAVDAEVYENWTDVSGILMADPRIIDDPAVVEVLTYKEIRELAAMGANVFHEEAVSPVKDHDIPINIRNTNDPEKPGTMIVASRQTSFNPIAGISGKDGYRNIFVEKLMLNRYPGFRESFLNILHAGGIIPEFESAGCDSISFLAPENQLGNIENILVEIKKKLDPGILEVRHSLALIGIVGGGISELPGVAATVFSSLQTERINVRFINYGGSDLTLVAGVSSEDYIPALRAIHRALSSIG